MESNNKPSRYINKKITYTRKVFQTQVTTKEINHEVITYNENKYVVCLTIFNENDYKLYLIDHDNIDKVIYTSWHYKPMGHYQYIKKFIFLYNLYININIFIQIIMNFMIQMNYFNYYFLFIIFFYIFLIHSFLL